MKVVLTLAWILCGISVAGAQQADLKELQSKYNGGLLLIETDYMKRQADILSSYTNELLVLRNRVQKAGDLDKFTAVVAEITRYQSTTSMPVNVPGVPELKSLASTCEQRLRDLTLLRAQAIVNLALRHDKSLEALQKKLTQQDSIEAAAAVQEERKAVAASESLATARSLVPATSQAAPPGPAGISKMPLQIVPLEIRGHFYVSVDDSATVYVKGRQVHHASLGETSSGEVTLSMGDSVAVHLVNKVTKRRFAMSFLSADRKYVISFKEADYRVLADSAKLELTQKDFDQLAQKPEKTMSGRPPFHFPSTSDWVWGPGNRCWLISIIRREMFQKQAEAGTSGRR